MNTSVLVELLTSEPALTAAGTILGAAALFLWRKMKWDEKKLKAGADVAFAVVDAVAKRTPTKIDDKAALGLAALKAHLGRELTPSEVDSALKHFSTVHDVVAKREAEAKALLDRAVAAGVLSPVPAKGKE